MTGDKGFEMNTPRQAPSWAGIEAEIVALNAEFNTLGTKSLEELAVLKARIEAVYPLGYRFLQQVAKSVSNADCRGLYTDAQRKAQMDDIGWITAEMKALSLTSTAIHNQHRLIAA